MIAVRILPGTVCSSNVLYGEPGAIGKEDYDSYLSSGVYVVRRSCQVLPCFVVYY
jgi:hypothetical protein